MSSDLIDRFDRKVVSFWLLIGIGAAKSVEHTINLLATEFIHVTVIGMDVSLIALYLGLMMAGLTGLIAWETIGH